VSRVFLILFLVISSIQSYGLDLEELHLFTDKKGNQITANLLKIAEDRRTAKIRREDGIEFSLEIVLFSLDDQQYIKDWMAVDKIASSNQPKASEFHLDIKVVHKESASAKHSNGSLELESKPHFFDVSISNTSRETLEGAVLEYAIVWEEAVSVHEDEDNGGWDYTSTSSGDAGSGDRLVRLQRSVPLEVLAFNRDAEVKTEEVLIDRVVYSDGDLLREDLFWGVLVRVLDSDGQLLAEVNTGKSELTDYSWEKTLTIASVDPEEE
jgi:hypothetical protein